jgi:hypothetical protein
MQIKKQPGEDEAAGVDGDGDATVRVGCADEAGAVVALGPVPAGAEEAG